MNERQWESITAMATIVYICSTAAAANMWQFECRPAMGELRSRSGDDGREWLAPDQRAHGGQAGADYARTSLDGAPVVAWGLGVWRQVSKKNEGFTRRQGILGANMSCLGRVLLLARRRRF